MILMPHSLPANILVVVEQNRLLSGMVKIIQTEERSSGRAICNEQTCPTMSAGS